MADTTNVTYSASQPSSIENDEFSLLRRIREAYNRPKIFNLSDILDEDSISDKPSILFNTKALSRGEDKVTTQLYSDPDEAYTKRALRRLQDFDSGFFSDRSQPYQSLGKLYTSTPELLKASLMSEISAKVDESRKIHNRVVLPVKTVGSDEQAVFNSRPRAFSAVSKIGDNQPQIVSATNGIDLIRQKLQVSKKIDWFVRK